MLDPVKQAQEIARMREAVQSPAMLEIYTIVAQEKFAKFQAYKRAGFDVKQSLELVIREGVK